MLILVGLLPLLQHAIQLIEVYNTDPAYDKLLQALEDLVEAIEIFEGISIPEPHISRQTAQG
jgi:hypothetical protein